MVDSLIRYWSNDGESMAIEPSQGIHEPNSDTTTKAIIAYMLGSYFVRIMQKEASRTWASRIYKSFISPILTDKTM